MTPEAIGVILAKPGRAVRAGQFAPTFRLADVRGGSAALVELVGRGALVISFYRGVWCSFCETALEALARADGDIRAAGATQVAIGPPPVGDDQRRRLQGLAMPVLVDRGLRAASAYGLTMALPDEAKGAYAAAGYVPQTTADGAEWLVPIPATYIVDRGGRIAMAAIDADYRNRLDPAALVSALRGLQRRTGASPATASA
jgi:peroxiredoxin